MVQESKEKKGKFYKTHNKKNLIFVIGVSG